MTATSLAVTRTRRGSLYTPVHEWRHPGTGHRVVAVGVVHLGDSAYFRSLRSLVDDFDTAHGFAVHYELMADGHEEVWASATEAEREMREYMRKANGGVTGMAASLRAVGLTGQFSGALRPAEHWRNVDATLLDLIRAHDHRVLREVTDSMAAFAELGPPPKWIGAVMRFVLRYHGRLRALHKVLPSGTWLDDRFILDHRNGLAVDAAVAETRPVVTIWSAAHLSGIGASLARSGYTLDRCRWVLAVARKPLPEGMSR